MDTTTRVIADRIEARRIATDTPLLRLANEVGMQRNTLRLRLAGHGDFTLPQLIAIARVLDVRLSEITKGIAA